MPSRVTWEVFRRWALDRGMLVALEYEARRVGATLEEVVGEKKTRRIVAARRDVWRYLLREYRMSAVEISMVFGRDRSAVSASLGADR